VRSSFVLLVVALCVALSVALSGCKKPTPVSPPAVAVDVDADAGARAPAQAASRPVEALEDAVAPAGPTAPSTPSTPSTLSLFEPSETHCEWTRVDPVAGLRAVLASLPGSCVGVRASYSPDASRAVVWFDPTHVQSTGYSSQTSSKPGYPEEVVDERAVSRAYLVLTGRTAPELRPLPLPAIAGLTLEELGVDDTGAVYALLQQELTEAETKGGTVTSGGESFDLSTISEGLPVLVHAYRREGSEWKRTETKLSTTGWDYAMGVKELETFGKLGPRSVELASALVQGEPVGAAEAKRLKALLPKGTTSEDGEWVRLGAAGAEGTDGGSGGSGAARVTVWQVTGEFSYATGLVALGGKALPKLGFTDGDLVALATSGPYLLVSASNVGTHPRLYALPSGKLVFGSDTARAATFWPAK